MSGIAGWVSDKIDLTKKEHILSNMSLSLKNRGPDDFGQVVLPQVALLHRRLKLSDIDVCQPLTKTIKGQTYTIIYNGEIYNLQELLAELKSQGIKIESETDIEALLYAYAQWKEECLVKLNGVFAFGIWEHNNKRLFLARDRLGVKPLFYYVYDNIVEGKGIIFASEIKTLLENPLVERVVDLDGLRQIFLLGPGRKIGSGIIKNVQELKPAHYLIYQEKGIEIKEYWKLKAYYHEDNLFMTIEKTRWLMLDAIKRQLASKAPLGCFMSGGLDSSIIVSVAAAMLSSKGQRLNSFSVDYKDNEIYFERNAYQPDSDYKYIAQMRDFVNSVHHLVVLDNEELGKALARAAEARDLPGMADIDSSLLMFCEAINKNIKIALSGECADEVFGGYPWYHERNYNLDAFPWAKSLDIRTKLTLVPEVKKDAQDYVRQCFLETANKAEVLPQESEQDKHIKRLFLLNLEWFGQTLIERTDRMTSHAGLVARMPFCDYRLIEYSYNMPWKYKAYNGREKGILREAVKDMLPYDIIKRKKSPYPKTFSPIYLNYVKEQVREIINNPNKVINELIDKEYVKSLLEAQNDFDKTFYGQLMRLPQLLGYIIQLDYFFESKKLKVEL